MLHCLYFSLHALMFYGAQWLLETFCCNSVIYVQPQMGFFWLGSLHPTSEWLLFITGVVGSQPQCCFCCLYFVYEILSSYFGIRSNLGVLRWCVFCLDFCGWKVCDDFESNYLLQYEACHYFFREKLAQVSILSKASSSPFHISATWAWTLSESLPSRI